MFNKTVMYLIKLTFMLQLPESWDYDCLGCDLKHPYQFEIFYESSHDNSSTARTFNQSQNDFTFMNLEPGTTYTFFITVKNYAGCSSQPTTIECNTTIGNVITLAYHEGCYLVDI